MLGVVLSCSLIIKRFTMMVDIKFNSIIKFVCYQVEGEYFALDCRNLMLILKCQNSEGINNSGVGIKETDSMCLIMAWSKCYVGNWNILQKNLDTAKASVEVLIADRQFLKDRVTISQVRLLVV
jgi:hypothetical protein